MKKLIIPCIAILFLLSACSSQAKPSVVTKKNPPKPITSVTEAIDKSIVSMEKMKSFQVAYTKKYTSDEKNTKTSYRNHIIKNDTISLTFIDPNQYHLYERIHEDQSTDKEKEPDLQTEIYVKNKVLYLHYFDGGSKNENRWEKGKPTKSMLQETLNESPAFLDPSYILASLKPNQKQVKLTQTQNSYILELTLNNKEEKTTIMGFGKGGKGFVDVPAIKKIPLSTIKVTIDKETLLTQKVDQHVSYTITADSGDVIKADEYQTHTFKFGLKSITVPKEALTTQNESSIY
jgi:outer membrane lipoprotein-sorting protein